MSGIKVMTNTAKLRHKVSPAAFNRARQIMANQIGMDSNRFVPKKNGP
jgi:hypothetical protein